MGLYNFFKFQLFCANHVLIKTVLFTFIQELGSQMPSKFAGGNLASEIKLEHYFFFKLAILGFLLFCKSLILSLEISSISLLKC
jgi:hypothetical protein